ncbi:MAG: PAS domain S-box protein [Sulfuricella sp.]
MLDDIQRLDGYQDISLYDRQGLPRVSTTKHLRRNMENEKLVMDAMRSGKAAMSDIHRSESNADDIVIDLVAPMVANSGNGEQIVGAVKFQIDPHLFLYPLLHEWPTPSLSAETSLVRRDGDAVLFLNEVRHLKGSALSLRVPLAAFTLPAAMAVLGKTSSMDGFDYRGVAVVAEMRRVPGTDWFMVSKIEKAEIFAPISHLKKWSLSLGLVFALLGGILLYVWLKANHARHKFLDEQRAAAVEREMMLEHFAYFTRHANDVIFVADESTRIIEANEHAMEVYGYTREELLQMHIRDFRDPAEDPALVQGQIAQLKALGELRFEAANRRKDGSILFVEVSARYIESQGVKYLQAIIRDVTKRKRAEEALAQQKDFIRHVIDTDPSLIFVKDVEGRFLLVNQAMAAIYGKSPEDLVGRKGEDFIPDKEEVHIYLQADREVITKRRKTISVSPTSLSGYERWFQTLKTPMVLSDGTVNLLGIASDITERMKAEERLRQSAAEIEDLYNNAPCGYHSLDKKGVFIRINNTELQWLGYTREELIGKVRISDLYTPQSQLLFEQTFPRLKETGAVHDLEIDIVRKDGTLMAVLLNATAIYDAQGQFLMSRSTLHDITVRKFAEEELRLHSAIVSHMEEGVFLTSVRDGVIVYANPKFEKMFGYEPGELIGKHVSSVNAPTYRDPETTAKMINEVLIRKGSWYGEVLNVKQDGTPFWCHASVSTFEHHHYGTVWVAIHQDITERKLAENRLSESEERFRSMADKAPVMIWMAEAHGTQQDRHCHDCRDYFTQGWHECSLPTLEPSSLDKHECRSFFNQRWHDFTGLTTDQLQNYNWQYTVHLEDRAYCLDNCEAAFLGARPFKIEYRLRRHDGVFRWVQDTGVPRFDEDGNLLGFIGTCFDITEQKMFEEMRTEIERIGRLNIAGEMASGLAHELSQPLGAASIYLDGCLNRMAEDDWDREKLQKAVRQAHIQTQRAGNIISHLKEMMRKQGRQCEMMDINSVIKDSVNFLEQDLNRYSIAVVHDLCDLPLTSVNKIEIEQILLNLMKNAIDSMSSQARRELRLATRLINSGTIMTTVSDTGKGIPPDELDKVFNPFQTTKQNGLGLGLGICRSLIENYGGKIWAEKRSDCGMEFNFTLPVEVMYE